MTKDERHEVVAMLQEAIPYIQQANQRAEAAYDKYNASTYMDGGLYEVMQETADLLKRIEAWITVGPFGTDC